MYGQKNETRQKNEWIIPSHALRGSWSLTNFHNIEDEDDLSTGKEKSARASLRKTNSGDGLGSSVDALQKPNWWSLVQDLERQWLRRHLPSRFSVRAELRDGDSFFAAGLYSKLCVVCGGLGSRVDALYKPNFLSLVQGLERQGLRRHLPSRSSVHAELRDARSSVHAELRDVKTRGSWRV
jgi:hypothetical protein